MHDPQTVQRFIELRAQGRTYAQIVAELEVSKTTLIAWSNKHRFELQNLRAIELEALCQRWLASTTERVSALGEQLRRVETEIAKRDPVDLTTAQLYALAHRLRRQIEQATGPAQFSLPVAQIPDSDYHEQVQDWTG